MDLGTDRVLVTGANGWLGMNLVQALTHGLPDCPELAEPQPGLKLQCLILPGSDSAALERIAPEATIVSGDLRSAEDCRRFCKHAEGAVVLHTAGIIHPRRAAEFFSINRDGAKKLLEAASAAGARRAVVMSSNSPCGCNPHPDHVFDEQSPFHPYMKYGRSKMQMEQAVEEIQSRGKLETVRIRAPWFYGPRQPPRQTLFFTMIRDGKMPIVGSGENRRSMAYMDNLCQGLLLAAAKPQANGQVFWIADERPYPMNEVVDTVEKLLEDEFGQTCTHKRMKLPWIASEVAGVIDWSLQAVGLYHQKFHVLSEMNKTIACSVQRAQRELGYHPTVALEEGMRRSIRWCFDEGLLP